MGALKLYYLPESGPCRSVMMTAKVLGIDLELIQLDLFKGEHHTPEFLKLNPAHKIPTLVDGDFNLTESRSIMTYLVEKYGKNDSLYPKDPKKRALINQKLYFDIGTLYEAIVTYYYVVYFGSKTFDETKMPKIQNAFQFFNTFLENSKFAAGDTLSVADITLVSSVGTAIAVFDFDIKPYPNVKRWYEIVKSTLPDYKSIMEDNEHKLRILVDSFKTKNNQALKEKL